MKRCQVPGILILSVCVLLFTSRGQQTRNPINQPVLEAQGHYSETAAPTASSADAIPESESPVSSPTPEMTPEPVTPSPEPTVSGVTEPEAYTAPEKPDKTEPTKEAGPIMLTAAPFPYPELPPLEKGDLNEVTLVPMEFTEQDEFVYVNGEVVYTLDVSGNDKSQVVEGVDALDKLDLPIHDIYLITTSARGNMPHGEYHSLIVNGSVVELPDIVTGTGAEFWSLSDSCLFIKSETVSGHKLNLICLDTLNNVLLNRIIFMESIGAFEVYGNQLVMDANHTDYFIGIVEDGYARFELGLDEILATPQASAGIDPDLLMSIICKPVGARIEENKIILDGLKRRDIESDFLANMIYDGWLENPEKRRESSYFFSKSINGIFLPIAVTFSEQGGSAGDQTQIIIELTIMKE